jgi:hypothetical protein
VIQEVMPQDSPEIHNYRPAAPGVHEDMASGGIGPHMKTRPRDDAAPCG